MRSYRRCSSTSICRHDSWIRFRCLTNRLYDVISTMARITTTTTIAMMTKVMPCSRQLEMLPATLRASRSALPLSLPAGGHARVVAPAVRRDLFEDLLENDEAGSHPRPVLVPPTRGVPFFPP